MAWLKKKVDPISDRAQALNEEIAALESEIKKLDAQLQRNPSQPRLRSTAVPHGAVIHRLPNAAEVVPAVAVREPVFESIDKDRLTARSDAQVAPEHYNELGVRKYDLPALVRRIRGHLHGPSATNPKLVSYLAAGGIQGLRPLRYEQRVARYRFILFVGVVFAVLLGMLLWVLKHHA